MNKKKVWIITAIILLFAVVLASFLLFKPAKSISLAEMKSKQKALTFAGYYSVSSESASVDDLVLDEAKGTYYFTDIDYTSANNAQWDVCRHLYRLRYILQDNGEDRLINDSEYLAKVSGALQYFLDGKFVNSNWWNVEVAVPKTLADIAFMLEGRIPEAQWNALLEQTKVGSSNHPNSTTYDRVGANLVWGAVNSMKYAMLTNDTPLFEEALDVLRSEINIKNMNEGIQEDGGFYQHGIRWYSGKYGLYYFHETVPIMYLTQGTKYQLTDENIDALLVHVLDGLYDMQHNGYFDYGAVGRDMSRIGSTKPGLLLNAVGLLSKIEDLPRSEEIQSFYAELCDESLTHDFTNWYDSICLLNQSHNDSYISVKGQRNTLSGAEAVNNEGILCYNMSYGTHTCFMKSGQEYYDIAPVWDYAKIPGTTAREEDDRQIKLHNWVNNVLPNDLTKGLVEDDCGIMYEKPQHAGISLNASFFTYKGNLIALGSEIKAPAGQVINTTVNQCYSDNFSKISDNLVTNGGWYYQNLDTNTAFVADVSEKTGSWQRNNAVMSDEPVTKELFTLTIPYDGYQKYAYLVSPEENMPAVTVLANDKDCQAILVDGETVMAVFHTDKTITANGKNYSGKKGELKIFR